MSVLTEGLPDCVWVGETRVPVETDYRMGILLTRLLADTAYPVWVRRVVFIKLACGGIPALPPDALLAALFRFYGMAEDSLCLKPSRESGGATHRGSNRESSPKSSWEEKDLSAAWEGTVPMEPNLDFGMEPNLDSVVEPILDFVVEPVFDFVVDGDRILASFQQAYGINLTTEPMHWHRFVALLTGLPADTVFLRTVSLRLLELGSIEEAQTRHQIRQMQRMVSLPRRQAPHPCPETEEF